MFNYKPYIKSLAKFMVKNGFTARPLPKIVLSNKKQKGFFISTGCYDPEQKAVFLYINKRHPKDVLRSLAHELIHHKQFLDKRIDTKKYNGPEITANEYLMPFEMEAYLWGNIAFRKWTELCHHED